MCLYHFYLRCNKPKDQPTTKPTTVTKSTATTSGTTKKSTVTTAKTTQKTTKTTAKTTSKTTIKPTTKPSTIKCYNCTIASEGSQSVDQCKSFDSQTPTCPPSQYCISFSGIMHEESNVIDSKIYTCDTVLYQNHFSWALKGKIKTIRHA